MPRDILVFSGLLLLLTATFDALARWLFGARVPAALVVAVNLLAGLALLILIAQGLQEYRIDARCRHGLCLRCGYNLTGNISGVCPECGEKIGRAHGTRRPAR